MINCYRTLGVKDFAPLADIKTAYRKLSKKFHPDVNDGDPFFEERFKEIQYAYEILTDDYRRSIHDTKLRGGYTSSAGANTANQYQQKQQGQQQHQQRQRHQQSQSTNQQKTGTPPKQPGSQGQEKSHETTTKNHKTNKTDARFNKISAVLFWAALIGGVGYLIVTKSRQELEQSETYTRELTSVDTNTTAPSPAPEPVDTTSTDISLTAADDNTAPPRAQSIVPARDYYTIGATKDEVAELQGRPGRVSKFEQIGEEIWTFGSSTVTFSYGKLKEYDNHGRNLKVLLIPKKDNATLKSYSIGATKDEVLQVEGTPARISTFEPIGEEIWTYSSSTVTFSNGRLKEYDNNGELSVVLGDVSTSQRIGGYFKIGSTKKEVLSIQGDPNRISKFEPIGEEIWTYGSSTVTFQNGRVKEYDDYSNNLRVRY
jgi:hypothetical protein